MLQIVFRRPENFQEMRFFRHRFPEFRNFDFPLSRKIFSRQRIGISFQVFDRSRRDNRPALYARIRPDIDDKIRKAHRLLVMFDHDQAVSLRTEPFQDTEQHPVVPGVQSNAWLVQNIQNALKSRTDSARKTYPLRFAARKRFRSARKGQVSQPDTCQKSQTVPDFLEKLVPDMLLSKRKLQRSKERFQPFHGHPAHLIEIQVSKRDSESHRRNPRPMANRTFAVVHELLKMDDVPLVPQRLHQRDDSRSSRLFAPVQNGLSGPLRKLFPGRVEREPFDPRDLRKFRPAEIRKNDLPVRLLALERAFPNGKRRIRYNQVFGKDVIPPKALAMWTLSIWIVKGKEPRFELRNGYAAIRAGKLRSLQAILAVVKQKRDKLSAGKPKRAFEILANPGKVSLLYRNAIDNRFDRVLFVAHQQGNFASSKHFPVNANARKALFQKFLEFLAVFALAFLDYRSENRHLSSGAFRIETIDNLVNGRRPNLLAAPWTMRRSKPRKEQTQEVENFYGRPHGRTRIPVHCLLVDGYRRGNSRHRLHVRTLHHADKLPRICRERIHVATLALFENRVEG